MSIGKEAAVLGLLLLTGCNPSAFVRPLHELKAADGELRDAYFQQLRIARDARQESFAVAQMQTLWVGKGDAKAVAANIVARARTPELNAQSLQLRHAAFDAFDGYTGVLLAIASGEATTEIVADVKGLAGDFSNVVAQAKQLQGVGRFAEDARWLGPLQGIAGLFGSVLKIVADGASEKAIRESIVEADKPLGALLDVLQDEARYANGEARRQYRLAADLVDDRLKNYAFNDKAGARKAATYLARIDTKAKQLPSAAEIDTVFAAARSAQAALVRKAAKPDYPEILDEIRSFKKAVLVLKSNLDAVERAR